MYSLQPFETSKKVVCELFYIELVCRSKGWLGSVECHSFSHHFISVGPKAYK
jgi:hypothetical protein